MDNITINKTRQGIRKPISKTDKVGCFVIVILVFAYGTCCNKIYNKKYRTSKHRESRKQCWRQIRMNKVKWHTSLKLYLIRFRGAEQSKSSVMPKEILQRNPKLKREDMKRSKHVHTRLPVAFSMLIRCIGKYGPCHVQNGIYIYLLNTIVVEHRNGCDDKLIQTRPPGALNVPYSIPKNNTNITMTKPRNMDLTGEEKVRSSCHWKTIHLLQGVSVVI